MAAQDVVRDEIIDELLGSTKSAEDLFGKDGLLKNLTKRLMERLLEAEMSNHLGYMKHAIEGNNTGNSRNGKTKKTVKTGNGDIEITVPRDRESDFAPVLIGKRESRLAGLDDNILSLYAKGMTVRDIQAHLFELYGTEISRDLISTITDAVLEDVKAWRSRPLDELYPIVFIDGFVAKCRLDGRVENRTVYVIYGINLEGEKDFIWGQQKEQNFGCLF
jgi:putative transposase